MELSVTNLLFFLVLIYYVGSILWRRYDQLSYVPGPFLAAIGPWYERYYDIVKKGKFLEHLELLHQSYGSYVRVNHNEVHTTDLKAYRMIFASGHRFIKAGAPAANAHPMLANAMFGVREREAFKVRKNIYSSLFSKANAQRKEPIVHEKIKKLLMRYDAVAQAREVLDIGSSLRCLNLEVVDSILFNSGIDAIPLADYKHPVLEAVASQQQTMHLFRHFPTLAYALMSLPTWISNLLSTHTSTMITHQEFLEKRIKDLRNNYTALDRTKGLDNTILQQLLSSETGQDRIPLDDQQIRDDFYTFMFGGIDTPAFTIRVAIWHVGRSKEMQARLFRELQTAMESSQSVGDWAVLEQLPYLTGVIKEALRIGGASPGKLIREVPESGVRFGNIYLPPKTHVSMSLHLVNMNEELFPEPAKFDPERWIGEQGRHLSNFPATFGAGTRACLGIHSAWCLLYLTISSIFRRYEVEIVETAEWDMGYTEHLSARPNGPLKAIVRRRESTQ